MNFNTPYSSHNDPISFEEGPSATDQQYKQSCDINFIVNQYVKQGIPIPQQQVSYADLTSVEDYESALLTVAEYKSAFESLPATERERFHGDVTEFLSFISNPDNLKESVNKNYVDPNTVDKSLFNPQPPVEELNPVKPSVEPSGEAITSSEPK